MRTLILAAMLVAPVSAPAAPIADAASARAFVELIYHYYRKGGTGAPMDRPARWFEPVLARAIQRDIAKSERTGDVGKLDADLFCDCQDFDALHATIDRFAVVHGRTHVTVHFSNGGPITIRLTLVWTKAGWRVSDIRWPDRGTVRELFLAHGGEG